MNSKSVLVLGAGRSSTSLINYLLTAAAQRGWSVTVGDASERAAQERVGQAGQAIFFDINQTDASTAAIEKADVVVSLLPAHLHILVAKICLQKGKHLLTASYVSEEMRQLDEQARDKGLLFLNECGLDPGIDHMSAMQVIDKIKAQGGRLTSFESFTGGLIAPQTDPENPWRYKFTWNPRNVVMAGQGTAKYLRNGQFKYIPYQQLFKNITPVLVPGFGAFEGYANRDSLKYRTTYSLHEIDTMLRGTLRNQGFCEAWDIFVQLGCCDDTYAMEDVSSLTHQKFIASFLSKGNSPKEEIMDRFNLSSTSEALKRLEWSGLFSNEPVGLMNGTPAQILEYILNKTWKLQPGDQDFIVMWHRFQYVLKGKEMELQAYLTALGEDETQTAMAKTVGLPLAISTKLLLEDKITARGVVVPVTPEFYNPILNELKNFGIELKEQERIVG